MKQSRFVLVACCCVVALFIPVIAAAQGNRASITGTVVDGSGALVAGAQVVARNIETAVETTAVSNDRGIYFVPNLPPGNYSVVIRKEGFKLVEFVHVNLILDQVAQLNATLAPGVNGEQHVQSIGPAAYNTRSCVDG